MRTSAARQVSLAPLLADAAEVAKSPSLPAPVREALQQLLALPASLVNRPSAADIQKALKQSGVLLEAHLADPRTPFAPAPDLKQALLTLRHALHDWVERVPHIATPTASEAMAVAAASAMANIRSAVAHNPLAASVLGPGVGGPPVLYDSSVPAPPPPVNAKALPPPYRGAPTTGQGPVAASIEMTAPLEQIRDTLIERTEGALARVTMLQSASLGDGTSALQQPRHDHSPHWNFEMPFVAPAGTAVAHFEIARDGHKSATPESKDAVWRANFSIDLEPIGPVHAQVAVVGTHTSVRLWAERKASAAALRANASELAQGLARVALESTELLVREGVPPRPVKPSAGSFVDRAT
jgi:hypothetical protein